MAELTFVRLPGRPEDWDSRVAVLPGKTVFHEAAWLDHVASIHPRGRVEYYEIHAGGEVVGLHCGLRVTKLGLPIHGSPLGGTGTNFLGPLVRDGVDQVGAARALADLAGPRSFLHLELAHPGLDPARMQAAGYAIHESVTHIVPLGGGEEAVWDRLKGTCRNRVRKAQHNGLVAEEAPDRSVVDEFYDQFIEVYGKQGMVTPFGHERPASLYRFLHPAGRLLAMRVRHGEETLAAGLFPYDEHAIYFWGAGSWLRHQHLYPNELLHWAVMRFAASRGIAEYNMCGGRSQFKNKFGGADAPYLHFSRSALPGLQVARRWYRAFHFWRLRGGRRAGR